MQIYLFVILINDTKLFDVRLAQLFPMNRFVLEIVVFYLVCKLFLAFHTLSFHLEGSCTMYG